MHNRQGKDVNQSSALNKKEVNQASIPSFFLYSFPLLIKEIWWMGEGVRGGMREGGSDMEQEKRDRG